MATSKLFLGIITYLFSIDFCPWVSAFYHSSYFDSLGDHFHAHNFNFLLDAGNSWIHFSICPLSTKLQLFYLIAWGPITSECPTSTSHCPDSKWNWFSSPICDDFIYQSKVPQLISSYLRITLARSLLHAHN